MKKNNEIGRPPFNRNLPIDLKTSSYLLHLLVLVLIVRVCIVALFPFF